MDTGGGVIGGAYSEIAPAGFSNATNLAIIIPGGNLNHWEGNTRRDEKTNVAIQEMRLLRFTGIFPSAACWGLGVDGQLGSIPKVFSQDRPKPEIIQRAVGHGLRGTQVRATIST